MSFHDGGLSRGQIVVINFEVSISYYFQAVLDNKPGAHYAMRFDSILLYKDNKLPGFSQYCLPSCCPGNPDNKIAQLQVSRKIGWMVDNDYTDKEDVANDKATEFNNCNNDEVNNDANKHNDDDDDL
jgi:hypothetical protein